jgi:flagellar hook assembly protein FlgD
MYIIRFWPAVLPGAKKQLQNRVRRKSRQDYVTITVYNLLGQVIKVLVDKEHEAGSYKASWNGTNFAGQMVGTRIYFYRIKANGFQRVKKLVLVR